MSEGQPPESVETIWQLKPWWCQPWSILLTGVAVVAVSWWWLQLWWLTAVASAAVIGWWALFLILMPRAWRQASTGASARE